MQTDLSVLLPSYNEAPNLEPVIEEIIGKLRTLGCTWEVVVVDDGSTDDTEAVMASITAAHPSVRHVKLRTNKGKSAALSVGFTEVTGDVIVLMDADGQDDPAGLPAMLDALDRGLDLVTGSRAGERNDRFVKRHTSRLYNAATARLSGVDGEDFNSGFKMMRRDVAERVEMRGELHRYIPTLAAWEGFAVGEVRVAHRARLHGSTKFGINRFWRGLLDLLTVKFLTTYNARPFHLFGGVGLGIGAVGMGLLSWMLCLRVLGETVGTRPALLAGILCIIVAIQLSSFGLLAELLVSSRRSPLPTYFEMKHDSESGEARTADQRVERL